MNNSTPQSTRALLSRFDQFNDSLLVSFAFSYNRDGSRQASLEIYARDFKYPNIDKWATVKFIMNSVSDAAFIEPHNKTLSVISCGLHICKFDSIIALEFGGEIIDDPETTEEVRGSGGYIIGNNLVFQIYE